MTEATGADHLETIRAAVSRLTEPVDLPIQMDDGTTSYGTVPSLWDMAEDALAMGSETSDVIVSRPHRSPIDLNLMEIRKTIAEFTQHELQRFHREHGTPLDLAVPMPAQIQALAGAAITWEKDELDFWAHRFGQWMRVIANYLEPVNRANRMRSPCPRCLVDRVRVDFGMGEVLAYPILIRMHHDRVIHYAQCQNADCGATWFRGDALHQLAEELAGTPQQHAGPLVVAERTLEPA